MLLLLATSDKDLRLLLWWCLFIDQPVLSSQKVGHSVSAEKKYCQLVIAYVQIQQLQSNMVVFV